MAAALSASLIVTGCAKKSENIIASYVSPMEYEDHSCDQLAAEARRIFARTNRMMGVQDKKARNDKTAMGVGLVLFWPALFFLKGDAETASEVARLKGQMEALEQASIRKTCGIVFKTPEPAQPPAKTSPDSRTGPTKI
ncbi:hypothetical protein [Maritimibacter sp. 55A14]|uniref:hypothetical protein n=1 Tax=Maritimibacter sp. 55A14 TaxID=2174844 RepID=UPI0018EE75EF|nr:hypothetical protein [Maritimibacter sp. 55A14]